MSPYKFLHRINTPLCTCPHFTPGNDICTQNIPQNLKQLPGDFRLPSLPQNIIIAFYLLIFTLASPFTAPPLALSTFYCGLRVLRPANKMGIRFFPSIMWPFLTQREREKVEALNGTAALCNLHNFLFIT